MFFEKEIHCSNSVQRCDTNAFLDENPILIVIFKIIGVQNQVPISFGTHY